MRYILNKEGYIFEVSFGAEIVCNLGTCTKYTGLIPEGYETLEEWHDEQVIEKKLNAWKIVDGNLVFDENKYNEHKELCEKQEREYATATNKYVNDKFNQVNNVVVDELTDHAEGTGIVRLEDSGNYDINSLKIHLPDKDIYTGYEIEDILQVKVTNDNLIKNELVTDEIDGVEVTINEDKTIVLNGIAEKDIDLVLCGTILNTDMIFPIKANTNYYQGGLIKGTSIILNSYDGEERTQVSNSGNGLININEDYVVTEVILHIAAGATFFNSKIYPMLTMKDTPEEYIENQENLLLVIDLTDVSYKAGDYLKIENNEVSLVSGKSEKYIGDFEKNLKAFYPITHVMINRPYNMYVDYYRDKYLVNTMNEIKSNLEGISLKVSETFEATDTISSENIIKLENAFAPSNLTELKITGEMQIVYPANDLYPADDLFPMETTLIQSKTEEVTEEAKRYCIPINYLHYIDENVHDEFILTPEECKIIRKVGENEDGTLYALEEDVEETFDGVEVPMFEGDNYFTLETFKIEKLYFKATYEINKMNGNYATKVELKLAEDIINAEVLKKVGNDEIIAKFNMAIQEIEPDENGNIPADVEKSIIEFLANKISIKSDYFELTKDGKVTATEGNIAGLRMWQPFSDASFLTYDAELPDGEIYRSGFTFFEGAPNFMIAGMKVNPDSPNDFSLKDIPFEVSAYGVVSAKYINLNGESGSATVNFDSGRTAMNLGAYGIEWYIDDEANGHFFSMDMTEQYANIRMYDAPSIVLWDQIHNDAIMQIKKYNPNAEGNTGEKYGHSTVIWADVSIAGQDFTGANYNLYVQGYAVQTNASDERLKENIVDSEIEALKLINKIHHKSFDWNKEKAHREGHIDIGYIAQELIEIDPNFVVYEEKFDTYQINTLYVLSTATKAIQELDDKIDKQQKMIDFLADKLGCKEELDKYMKGDN